MLKLILNTKVCPVCFHRFSEKDISRSMVIDEKASLVIKNRARPYLFGTRFLKEGFGKNGRSLILKNDCIVYRNRELVFNEKLILTCNNCFSYQRVLKLE